MLTELTTDHSPIAEIGLPAQMPSTAPASAGTARPYLHRRFGRVLLSVTDAVRDAHRAGVPF